MRDTATKITYNPYAFKKGGIPWNKGLKNWMSKEGKKRMIAFKLGKPTWNKGLKLTADHKRKLSKSKLVKPTLYWLGRRRPEMSGTNHFRWKGGISEARNKAYYSLEYKAWRKAVFQRDNYTCQECKKKRSGELQAHHIKRWCNFPDLRFEVNNGITLCEPCHREKTRIELSEDHRNQFKIWKLGTLTSV